MKKAIILLDTNSQTEGEVINIIECSDRGILGLQLPLTQKLWDCSQYAVTIGDRWVDGVFYRETQPVEPIITVEQEIAMIKAENSQTMLEQEEQNSQIAYIGMMAEVI